MNNPYILIDGLNVFMRHFAANPSRSLNGNLCGGILGTLSRLHLRDGKSFRLSDLPKTLNFVMDTSMKYQELNEVSNYLKERVAPLLTQKLKENL